MRNIFYVKGSEICPIQSLCGCLVMLWRPFVSSANIGKFPSNTSAYRVNTICLHQLCKLTLCLRTDLRDRQTLQSLEGNVGRKVVLYPFMIKLRRKSHNLSSKSFFWTSKQPLATFAPWESQKSVRKLKDAITDILLSLDAPHDEQLSSVHFAIVRFTKQ